MAKNSFVMLFLSLCFIANSQDINGIWKGKVVMAPSGCFPVYNIELQINAVGSTITGTAYHYSDSLNFLKENFQGTYNKDSNQIVIKEIGIVTFKIKEDCVPCIKTYTLSYHKGSGNVVTDEQLRGSWGTPSGKAIDGKTTCEPGTIVLNRVQKSIFKPDVKLPATLVNRTIELVKEIKVDTGTIKIDFYDNGQIDGDTISVYVNNNAVVSNSMLKTQPITISIKIDPLKKIQEVIMVGENLGSIPPNTALMIVTAGQKRYQLYLTSDEKKNAMVRFIYEDPHQQ